MLKSLQDPMGLPFYPWLFQALLVLTFTLHIMMVNNALGGISFAIYGFFKKKDDRWRGLSVSLAKVSTVSLSLAILFGVAPLLFVQTLYDPFWYASNSLLAFWVIAFILILILGYSLLYIFYICANKVRGGGLLCVGIISLFCILLSGAIMHILAYTALQPDKWLNWLTHKGAIDHSGLIPHTFSIPRFLHYIFPSFTQIGLFLMLYAWYFKNRKEPDYIEWLGKLGAKIALIFLVLQVVIGFIWLIVLPVGFRFHTNVFIIISVLLTLDLLFHLVKGLKAPLKNALPTAVMSFLTILTMVIAREALRMKYTAQYGYSIHSYRVNLDWGSTALFLITFVLGASVTLYLVVSAWQTGKTAGIYTANKGMKIWGNLSLLLLVGWIMTVVGLGLAVTIKNYL
jgi:hypothetical protein